MKKEEWINEFAEIINEKTKCELKFGLEIAEVWVEEMDGIDMTPEEAVDEEVSEWRE